MAPTKLLYRVPLGYNEHWGDEVEPSADDYERLDKEIAKRLPDDVGWCGDEILADADSRWFDADSEDFADVFQQILDEAYEAVFEGDAIDLP